MTLGREHGTRDVVSFLSNKRQAVDTRACVAQTFSAVLLPEASVDRLAGWRQLKCHGAPARATHARRMRIARCIRHDGAAAASRDHRRTPARSGRWRDTQLCHQMNIF